MVTSGRGVVKYFLRKEGHTGSKLGGPVPFPELLCIQTQQFLLQPTFRSGFYFIVLKSWLFSLLGILSCGFTILSSPLHLGHLHSYRFLSLRLNNGLFLILKVDQ